MRVTTEDLFGVSVDATPEQRSNLRLDVEVPKGTPLIRCKNLGDRWHPLGKTTGERLGPRYGLHKGQAQTLDLWAQQRRTRGSCRICGSG